MQSKAKRASREDWRKRVERWRDSGLTAEQFASEIGVKATTLKFWKYTFDKEARGQTTSTGTVTQKVTAASFVELQPATRIDAGFELDLGGNRRLRIPSSFDPDALRRLLDILDRAS